MTELARTQGVGVERLSERLGYGTGWLVDALPLGMQSDDFLVRFLSIFEEVATPLRASADSVARLADANVTRPSVVRYLGQWVGAPALHKGLDTALQRRIVLAAGAAIGNRATKQALESVLAAVTDGPVEVTDGGGVFHEGLAPAGPGAVTVRVASSGHLREADLVQLVVTSVPANVPLTVVCGDRTLYPVTEAVDQ